MERLLIEKIEEELINLFDHLPLFQRIASCSRRMLGISLCNTSVLEIFQKYVAYQEKVCGGHRRKTAIL